MKAVRTICTRASIDHLATTRTDRSRHQRPRSGSRSPPSCHDGGNPLVVLDLLGLQIGNLSAAPNLPLDDEEAGAVFEKLHDNVYAAFQRRTEETSMTG